MFCFFAMLSTQEYRQRCQIRQIPLISPQTESVLRFILQEKKPRYCLEIGSAVWYSGSMIADTIQSRWGKVYSFEIAYNVYTQALYHTKKVPNLTLYPWNFANTHAQIIPWLYDFVFIDGQKAQYDQYLMKVQPLLWKESVIVCDDVIKFQNKLTPLYGYLDKKQIFYHILPIEQDDGIMLIGDPSVIKPLIDKRESSNKQ